MPKHPNSNNDKKRSPQKIHSNNDRTKQIEPPDGYEFYNGQLIGPSSK